MNLTRQVNRNNENYLSRIRRSERGQILPMIAVMMGGFLCMCGFVIDVGRVYVSYNQLQAATDAAALAGGEGLPNSADAIANANAYGSASSGANSMPNASMVSGWPKVACISALNIPCDGSTSFNAIQVKQKVTVPMTFAQLFGASNVQVGATSTAAAKGSQSVPWNIALIIDTTSSMGNSNGDSCTDPTNNKKYTTRIGCALVGAKILMLNTAPCAASLSTCPGGTTNAVDMISLFVFPNVTNGTAKNDYTGSCSNPTTANYSYPTSTITSSTGYLPAKVGNPGAAPTSSTPTYQITPFLSDYRVNDNSSTLNNSSELVAAIGQNGTCKGLQTPGGKATFFAGAIYAASAALMAEQVARPGSQNALILLSDGEANSTDLATTELDGKTAVTTPTKTSPYTGYPSTMDQCQQAVSAANYATNTLKITVYSVAYGSSTTSGSGSDCTTDVKTSTNTAGTGISACTTMQDIASTSLNFYSDYTAKGGDSGCQSSVNPETGLANIFGAIAGTFSAARLVPNNAFT